MSLLIFDSKSMTPEEQMVVVGITNRQKENAPWVPYINQSYYFVDSMGGIGNSLYEKDSVDLFRLRSGNCFQTELEASLKRERDIVTQELWNYSMTHDGNTLNWNDDNQGKFYLYYHNSKQALSTDCSWSCQIANVVYFVSADAATEAAMYVGVDRIKQSLFGVKIL